MQKEIKKKKMNPLMNEPPKLYGREDVKKDLSWKPPKFKTQEYLYNSTIQERLSKVFDWAGTQISGLMEGVVEEFGEEGLAKVAKGLYKKRYKQAKEMLKSGEFRKEDVNPRNLASLIMEWDACLGIFEDVVESIEEKFHVRIYSCQLAKYFNRMQCIASSAEAQGLIDGLSNGEFVFINGPCILSGGDPYCEWSVEKVE